MNRWLNQMVKRLNRFFLKKYVKQSEALKSRISQMRKNISLTCFSLRGVLDHKVAAHSAAAWDLRRSGYGRLRRKLINALMSDQSSRVVCVTCSGWFFGHVIVPCLAFGPFILSDISSSPGGNFWLLVDWTFILAKRSVDNLERACSLFDLVLSIIFISIVIASSS